MKLDARKASLALAGALAAIGAASDVAGAQAPDGLKAGAARVEVTPNVADLPEPYKTIHDPLYVRAVVFDDGHARGAIVIADVSTFAPPVLTSLRRQIADQIHAPAANVLLATTHNHSAVRIDPTVEANFLPGSAKIAAFTLPRIMEAVKQAAASLQPVRIGYADGTTQVIGRRDRPAGFDRAIDEQLADKGPANASIGVIRVDTLSGQPLAFIFNSGLEPIVGLASPTEIGSDVAGATERYIERRYGDKAVAMSAISTLGDTPYNARRQGPQSPADPHVLIEAMSTLLGEDVLAAAAWIKPEAGGRIEGTLRVLQCPGKITTPLNIPERCSDKPGSALPRCVFTTKDNAPASLEVGVLKIGPVTFVQSDADIATGIWRKVDAPRGTALVSTSYGPTHYVVEDADYASNSYPATATMAKPGCAAQGFISTASQLIKSTR